MDAQTRPSIAHGIFVALLLSAVTLAAAGLFSLIIYGYLLLTVVLAGVAFLYVCILLHTARGQSGRVVVAVMSAIVLGGAALWLSCPAFILMAVATLWLVRSLTTYSSVLLAGADGILCVIGLLAGLWASTYTGSLAVGIWCFFLVQSLYVLIPRSMSELGKCVPDAEEKAVKPEPFDAAFQAAESILRGI